MKKIYFKTLINLSLFVLISFSAKTNAQCLNADVILKTQEQVDAWAANFPNCTKLSYTLRIGADNNGAPSDITDLSVLSMINEINGSLIIQNNGELESLDGLKITKINGRLTIGGEFTDISNTKLQNLDGLENLTSVGEFLMIRNNPVLSNLNSLSKLTNVEQDIEISGNEILTDISGLENTSFNPSYGLGLSIFSNPELATCDIPNFCSYLENSSDSHPRNIVDNLANCANEEAVIAACDLLSINDLDKKSVKVYPNPVKDFLYISNDSNIQKISLIDVSGKVIFSKELNANKTEINITHLKSGIYILKTITNNRESTTKIVKK